MASRVKPEGRLDAPLVLIGEAPGRQELRQGRPFVGPSGWLMSNEWWRPNSLSRSQFRIYNVFEYMAPKSNIALARKDEVTMWADTLHTRLLELKAPKVIVPTGNIALRALMRQPLWHNKSPTITAWRGSILQYTFDDGRTCKMIPTIHPAAVLRDTTLWPLCLADWTRIAEEMQFPELRLPQRTHHLMPCGSLDMMHKRHVARRYLDIAWTKGEVMAGDIETPRRVKGGPRHIECMAFSYQPDESLVCRYPEDRDLVKALCEGPCIKVGQNFLFDRYWLASEGITVRGTIHDLLSMHHALHCTLPHSLATMASLYTRQPYWKKSAKDLDLPDDVDTTPREQLMAYCGLDACVTRELFDILYDKLTGDYEERLLVLQKSRSTTNHQDCTTAAG